MSAACHWSETPDFKLQSGVIDIWLCRADTVQDRAAYFSSLLSAEEQARAQRFKFDIHRNRFIISHGFKRSVLAKYLAVEPASIQYQLSEKGKPSLLEAENKSQDLKFNLSHTQDISLLAVSRNIELGIDVEYKDRKTDWQGVCQRFFTEPEQEILFSLTKEDQKSAFFQLWTRKEAYMKVLGSGLSLPPTGFTLTVPPQPPALIQHHSTKVQASMQVEFSDINLPDTLSDYCATLAVESAVHEQRCYQYTRAIE